MPDVRDDLVVWTTSDATCSFEGRSSFEGSDGTDAFEELEEEDMKTVGEEVRVEEPQEKRESVSPESSCEDKEYRVVGCVSSAWDAVG